jgi:hypothetical protein
MIRGDISDGQTFNRYAYVNGDPVKYVGPLGLCKDKGMGSGSIKMDLQLFAEDMSRGKGTDKGLATRGYKPEPGERTFEGFVKNNVPVDKEITLHTNSPAFNTSPKNADG